eukprot:169504-Hanusia_phi.AAC.2
MYVTALARGVQHPQQKCSAGLGNVHAPSLIPVTSGLPSAGRFLRDCSNIGTGILRLAGCLANVCKLLPHPL